MHIKEALKITITGSAVLMGTGDVHDIEGNLVLNPEPPPSRKIVSVGIADEAVGKALSLLSKPDALTWVGLYRIHEMVESDIGGGRKLARMGWASARQQERFTHSANSVAVAGDAARHGRELGMPPRNPMSLDEAIAYCKYLVQAWIDSKRSIAAVEPK
jgi:hypothetical protein